MLGLDSKSKSGTYAWENAYILSVEEQIRIWKHVFDILMSNSQVVTRVKEPQNIPLSELPAEFVEIYASKLAETYKFVSTYLSKDEELEYLNQFYLEDYALISSLNLTHEMFIFSTFRLSILMDRKSILKNSIVEPELKQLITSGNWANLEFYHKTFAPRVFRFPEYPMSLVAPVVLVEGELLIDTFLQAFLLYEYPFGLAAIPTDSTYVHGGTMAAPGLFYSHDLLHWPVFARLVNRFPNRWERLQTALRELYLRNTKNDDILNYFIFMILHEGALDDGFPGVLKNVNVQEDIEFLLAQIPGEMKNRFDYHRSFLKNFLLAKLQSVLSKPFKLYAVDEIDEQRLDVVSYERTSKNSYTVIADMNSKGITIMKLKCSIEISNSDDPYFSNCAITKIDILSKHPNSEYNENQVIEKLLGEVLIKNPRYFFYIDVKDHLKVFRKLTKFPEEKDAYPMFLPWVEKETQRLLKEQKNLQTVKS